MRRHLAILTHMADRPANRQLHGAVTAPGATLAGLLEERAITQAELAVRMGVTPKFVNEVISAKASITPTIALALERALGVAADFWLAQDARYQESKARKSAEAALEQDAGWLEELPLGEMRKFGWIREQETARAYVNEGLRFFGVSSVSAWRNQYVNNTIAAAARRVADKVNAQTGAVAAWLRAGELRAADIRCRPFSRRDFLSSLERCRNFSLLSSPRELIERLTSIFAACGVAVAFVRAPRNCPVNGAVRWLSPHKALIQLNLGFRTDDALWRSFFHYCGHLALHGKKMLFLEDGNIDNEAERAAERFGADKLISPADWTRLTYQVINAASIAAFASDLGISPGIVLGRLQNEQLVAGSRFNELKIRYAWKKAGI